MKMLDDIHEFHAKFGFKPRKNGIRPSKKLIAFRLKFLLEELTELSTALQADDMAGATDALVDLAYVALGTAWLLNLPFKDAWERVHAANMRKVRATDPTSSKRGGDLDVVKPVGWVPPDVSSLIPADDMAFWRVLQGGDIGEQLDLIDYINQLDAIERKARDEKDQGDHPA